MFSAPNNADTKNTDALFMDIILKYFKNLSETQIEQFSKLQDIYADWNSKINVVSRKDIDNIYERHILHSLAIAKTINFVAGTEILDVGTGGGFPGIPLAIMFPEVKFHLVDSIGKKIKVVEGVVSELGLKNVTFQQKRSNEIRKKYDFVVSRAVAALPKFMEMTQHCIHTRDKNGLPNGLLFLKGGDISEEIKPYKSSISVFNIEDYFEEEFFLTKKVVYLAF